MTPDTHNNDERGYIVDYQEFIHEKSQFGEGCGFVPDSLPGWLYDFQQALVGWSLKLGRSAIFADCGMGKTAMQLAWADAVVNQTNKSVLIVTPLAVGAQTIEEAAKFGIDAKRSRDGKTTSGARVWVTNYEQLEKFEPSQFAGVVCDESSAIKDFKSARKGIVVEFMRTIQYRLLCTATAAPNDFWELGTSSEALGLLGFRDMITTFFKQETQEDIHGWGRTKYRFRGHAEQPFWSWVCSWARSLQKPSDLGFADDRFVLPPLYEIPHVIACTKPREGMLFPMAARDMQEERQERRQTIRERCEKAAEIALNHDGMTALWGELNDETDLLEKMVPDCVQVSGSMPDEMREERLLAFARGEVKRLVCKPKIGAWGLNFQKCHNQVIFPSHSFEQYYQVVRRCYRFGQTKPVSVHMVLTEGEQRIAENLERKKHQVETLFRELVKHMQDALHLAKSDVFVEKVEVPQWL